jgi:hypothetical protein
MSIAFVILAAYQSTFPKQKRRKVILLDANDSPVYQLEEWKRMVEKTKERLEECKEKAKERPENTQRQNNCLCLSHERKTLGSKLGPYWVHS